MKLPDFLVLGAQKAGSTWVYDNLKSHPDVFMPDALELHYFTRLGYATPPNQREYKAHFAHADGFKRVGEKTPGYFWTTDRARSKAQPPVTHNPDIPASVRAILGDKVDFIVSLRHPVSRAISALGHHVERGRIAKHKSLKDVAHTLGILDIGLYGAHLDAWFQAADPNRFEVLIFEDDIVADPKAGFKKLCRFLKVDDTFVPVTLREASNAGAPRKMHVNRIMVPGHPAPVGPDDIEYLIKAFAPDIEKAKRLLNNDLASWDAETARLLEWCEVARSVAPRGAKMPTERKTIQAAKPARKTTTEQQMKNYGLDAAAEVAEDLADGFVFEPPVQLSKMFMHGTSTIGAFSVAQSGHAYNAQIGRYCSISRNVTIGQLNHSMSWLSTNAFQFDQSFHASTGGYFPEKKRYDAGKVDNELVMQAQQLLAKNTKIGNDVLIGPGAFIAAGVTIEDGAVIAANAVVTKNVRAYAIVGGVPAAHIRYRFDTLTRTRLLDIKWWQYATWQLEGVPFSDPHAALDEIERRIDEDGMQPYLPDLIAQPK